MDRLSLYEEYTREDVNNIFNPRVKYTAGAGIYGIHGLIKVPIENKTSDYIFFISIGQDKLGYEFTEEISDKGELKWQSQPGQSLDNPTIKELINHNEDTNNIYLFIRHGKKAKEYVYLGNLSYVSHNPTKEKPVHFVWKILNWNQSTIDKLHEIGIDVIKDGITEINTGNKDALAEVKPPIPAKKHKIPKINAGNKSETYKPDYMAIQKNNLILGEAGEQLVYKKEKESLIAGGRSDLADKVIKVSDKNDKVGYDILSYDKKGNEKYIEVKTTTGGKTLGFYISPNEINVSKVYAEQYYIYRLYDFNREDNTSKYYVVKGSVEDNFNIKPTAYKATYNGEDYI